MENESDEILGIAIIEALRSGDDTTGTRLNEILNSVRFEDKRIKTYFYSAYNKNEFLNALADIFGKCNNNLFIPILQIETHGYEDGIRLPSDEIITWQELLNETRKINIVLKNKLALFICACQGNSIIGAIDPSKRAPFKFLISSFKILYPDDILIAFEEFYNSFLNGVPIVDCIRKMNDIIEAEKPIFSCITSRQYFDNFINNASAENFLNRLINQIACTEKESNSDFKEIEFSEVKSKVEMKIKTIFADLESTKDYFEMDDLQ